MTVTMNPAKRMGGNSWWLSWSSDLTDPTFYIYDLSGNGLLSTTKETGMLVICEAGESRVIEVRDAVWANVPRGFPGRLDLFWYATADTAHYRIEEYVGSAWALVGKQTDDGAGHWTWRTRFLEDITTHQFRIVPVGTNGNSGTAKTWSVLMVRHPDPPQVTFAYDEDDGTVAIAAA
jgi:hypothetical protein